MGTIADMLLHMCFGVEEKTARTDAIVNAYKILALIPTKDEISDTQREKDFVLGFIAQNQRCFINAVDNLEIDKMTSIYGEFADDFVYITTDALKNACKFAEFNYRKLVTDLVDDQFFISADKVELGRKTPRQSITHTINRVNTRCFRIPRWLIDGKDKIAEN